MEELMRRATADCTVFVCAHALGDADASAQALRRIHRGARLEFPELRLEGLDAAGTVATVQKELLARGSLI
jgi:hypothetical protein